MASSPNPIKILPELAALVMVKTPFCLASITCFGGSLIFMQWQENLLHKFVIVGEP